jgi:cytochrome P450
MARGKIPPGPKGHFLIGHMLLILRDPLDFPTRCARDYGDVVRLRFGRMVTYLLSHPEHIELVLRGNHRNFRKDKGTRLLSGALGQGLLTSEGDTWRRQRQLAQPAFQLDQVQKYGEVMVAYAQRLLQDWRAGEIRDVHADMMRLTLDVVARALFGTSVAGKAETVGRVLDVVMTYYAGLMAWFPWLRWVPTPGNRRFRQAIHDLDAVIYETIAQRRAGGPVGEDLLCRLLTIRDEAGQGMTDRQLRDEVVTLFLAGHETTALALSYCFYLLATHPAAEARLTAELDEVLRGRPPTSADVSRLRYTEWVVKESMRLYPPAPGIGREALSDCEIGGYYVPRGTQIGLMQWVVHRDPRWFDDPEAFKPERWDNDLAKRLPRGAYFPFGDGPRICIGNHFAMMETVLVLATILQRYRLELAPGYKLELFPSITLRPKHGVQMVVRERAGARDGQEVPASHAIHGDGIQAVQRPQTA